MTRIDSLDLRDPEIIRQEKWDAYIAEKFPWDWPEFPPIVSSFLKTPFPTMKIVWQIRRDILSYLEKSLITNRMVGHV